MNELANGVFALAVGFASLTHNFCGTSGNHCNTEEIWRQKSHQLTKMVRMASFTDETGRNFSFSVKGEPLTDNIAVQLVHISRNGQIKYEQVYTFYMKTCTEKIKAKKLALMTRETRAFT